MKPFFSLTHFQNQTLNIPNVMIQTRIAFLKYTPQVLERITRAIDENDSKSVQELLHKLKGSVGAFSPLLRDQVVSLEKELKLDDQNRISLESLIINVNELIREVKEFPI